MRWARNQVQVGQNEGQPGQSEPGRGGTGWAATRMRTTDETARPTPATSFSANADRSTGSRPDPRHHAQNHQNAPDRPTHTRHPQIRQRTPAARNQPTYLFIDLTTTPTPSDNDTRPERRIRTPAPDAQNPQTAHQHSQTLPHQTIVQSITNCTGSGCRRAGSPLPAR